MLSNRGDPWRTHLVVTTALFATIGTACRSGGRAEPPHVTDLSVFDLPREAASDAPPERQEAPRRASQPTATAVVAERDFDLSASSTYGGWPLENAVDGDDATSWYSGTDDSVAKGKSPFIQLTLRAPRAIHAVTILGNRDPAYFDGFGVLRGQLDVFDGDGRLVESLRADGAGDRRDYAFTLRGAEAVKTLRFTSLRDEGDKNRWGDVAIAEIRVE